MEGLGIIGMRGEDAAINVLGFAEAAGGVVLDG
jgi:hypothetical protein